MGVHPVQWALAADWRTQAVCSLIISLNQGICSDRAEPREVKSMKHVKAACILQTLVFAQKDDCGLTHEQQLKVNHDEVSRYKAMMDRSRTRYQITEETEQSDGSVLVRVRKQYNDKADVSEYFN